MGGRFARAAIGLACCAATTGCVSTSPDAKDAAARLRQVPGVASADVHTEVIHDSFQPTTTFTVDARPDPDAATLDGIMSAYGAIRVHGNPRLLLTWREGLSPRELEMIEGPHAPLAESLVDLPRRTGGVRARVVSNGIADTVHLALACPSDETADCVRELGPRRAVMTVRTYDPNATPPSTTLAARSVTYTGSTREIAAALAPEVYAAAPDATRITVKLDDFRGVDVTWGAASPTASPRDALQVARASARSVAAVVHRQELPLGIRYWVDGQLSTVPDAGCPVGDPLGADVSAWLTTTGRRAAWAPRC